MNETTQSIDTDQETPETPENYRKRMAVTWLKAAAQHHEDKSASIVNGYKHIESTSPIASDGSGDGDLARVEAAVGEEIQDPMSDEDETRASNHHDTASFYHGIADSIEQPDVDLPSPSEAEISKYVLAEHLRQNFIQQHNVDPIEAQIGLL